MEDNANSQPAMCSDARISDGAGWSGCELDEVPTVSTHQARGAFAGMSDDGVRQGAMIFGIIILGFAAIGVSIPQFLSEKRASEVIECVQIANNSERLSCYDKAAIDAAAPFKGGSPFSTYSRSYSEVSGQG